MSNELETVNTYADGYGRWHSTVTLDGGYGPAYLDERWSALRQKARRAIRREILARDPGTIWEGQPLRIRVEVAANNLDSLNLMRSVTFREM